LMRAMGGNADASPLCGLVEQLRCVQAPKRGIRGTVLNTAGADVSLQFGKGLARFKETEEMNSVLRDGFKAGEHDDPRFRCRIDKALTGLDSVMICDRDNFNALIKASGDDGVVVGLLVCEL